MGFVELSPTSAATGIRRSAERLRAIRNGSRRPRMLDSAEVRHRSGMGKLRREVRDLEHTAEVGESDKTPLILLGEVWVVSATAVLALIAIALLAYRLAS